MDASISVRVNMGIGSKKRKEYFLKTFFLIKRVKANQGDNTVSVAQGGTATPGTTKQLLPPDRVFKRNIYLYIHQIN